LGRPVSSRLSPKQVNLRLKQHSNNLDELRYSFHAGVSNTFSVNRRSAVGQMAISRDLPPETRMMILNESLVYFRLFRFLQPSSVASFSEIGFTISVRFSSLISTKQGAPILNGKAVSSLTFVGT
jgi:hypothetical protein